MEDLKSEVKKEEQQRGAESMPVPDFDNSVAGQSSDELRQHIEAEEQRRLQLLNAEENRQLKMKLEGLRKSNEKLRSQIEDNPAPAVRKIAKAESLDKLRQDEALTRKVDKMMAKLNPFAGNDSAVEDSSSSAEDSASEDNSSGR